MPTKLAGKPCRKLSDTIQQVPADILKDHEEYVAMVGNVRRRFHGTSCSNACQFFVDLRVSNSAKRERGRIGQGRGERFGPLLCSSCVTPAISRVPKEK